MATAFVFHQFPSGFPTRPPLPNHRKSGRRPGLQQGDMRPPTCLWHSPHCVWSQEIRPNEGRSPRVNGPGGGHVRRQHMSRCLWHSHTGADDFPEGLLSEPQSGSTAGHCAGCGSVYCACCSGQSGSCPALAPACVLPEPVRARRCPAMPSTEPGTGHLFDLGQIFITYLHKHRSRSKNVYCVQFKV